MIEITARSGTGVVYKREVQPVYETDHFALTEDVVNGGQFNVTHIPTGYKLPGPFWGYDSDIPMMSMFCDWIDEAYDWDASDAHDWDASDTHIVAEREGLEDARELMGVLESLWEALGNSVWRIKAVLPDGERRQIGNAFKMK